MSGYRDGAAVRRERLMRIVSFIRNNPGVVINRIQVHMSIGTGLSPKTTARYVQELVEYGLLAIEDQGFVATGKKI